MAQGTTSLLHQARDQAAHAAIGLPAGFVAWFDLAWYWPLLIGLGVASFYGAVREIKQWGALNSPSLRDSIIDASFVGFGGLIGAAIRHFTI